MYLSAWSAERHHLVVGNLSDLLSCLVQIEGVNYQNKHIKG